MSLMRKKAEKRRALDDIPPSWNHPACGRKLIQIAIIVLAIALWLSATSGAGKSPSEYEIKAAFLYNFARFAQWPQEAFSDANSPLVIGILGDDPFGNTLEETISGKTVNGRRLEIRRYREIRDLRSCHILFVSSSEGRRLGKVFDAVKNWHVLTVGETDGFAKSGGVINFFIEDKKIRFEVNLEASRKADVKISSKLLKLARIVKS